MYSTVLRYTEHNYITLHYWAMYCNALHCAALHYIVLHCAALPCTALYVHPGAGSEVEGGLLLLQVGNSIISGNSNGRHYVLLGRPGEYWKHFNAVE